MFQFQDVDQYSQNFAENAMTNEQMTFVEVKQYSSIVNPPVDVTLANTSTTTAQSKLDVDSIDEMKSERGEFVDERQTASNNPSINGGNESSIATAGQSKVDMIVDGVQFKWVSTILSKMKFFLSICIFRCSGTAVVLGKVNS